MKILVTGGAGYIGSHTCVDLLESGHSLEVVDDLSNSHRESLNRVEKLTGKKVPFHQVSLLETGKLEAVFKQGGFDAVIHFAAFKAVGESVEKPLKYYQNNVSGTINLLDVMRANGCRNLVYSSSCTVYGQSEVQPIDESQPTTAAESPYGWTKLMTEQVMRDLAVSDPEWNISLLRYFNPVGAHPSGEIGEDPNGIPNNLFPFITKVAIGQLPQLSVFGSDYPTPDGTCIRDYIHVMDLARAHVLAVQQLEEKPGLVTYNLGTGKGSSVLEVIEAFKKATGVDIPYQMAGRRSGDITMAYAKADKAAEKLGWTCQRDLNQMCEDGWNWQQKNPNGFQG